MARVAFIGLGVMGSRIAGHLQQARHLVTVYNRTVEKAQNWTSHYVGLAADTRFEVAKGAGFFMCCGGNDDDRRVTGLVDQFYSDVQQMGGGLWDTSSLIQRLRKFRKN